MAVALSASVHTKLSPYLQKAVSLFPGLKSMADDDLSSNGRSKQGALVSALLSVYLHAYNVKTSIVSVMFMIVPSFLYHMPTCEGKNEEKMLFTQTDVTCGK